jgi:hypothetical protein
MLLKSNKFKLSILILLAATLFVSAIMQPVRAYAAEYVAVGERESGWDFYATNNKQELGEDVTIKDADRILAYKDSVLIVFNYTGTEGDKIIFTQTLDYYNQTGAHKKCPDRLTFDPTMGRGGETQNGQWAIALPGVSDCNNPVYYNAMRVDANGTVPAEILNKASAINWGKEPSGCLPTEKYGTLPARPDTSLNYNCPEGGAVINGVFSEDGTVDVGGGSGSTVSGPDVACKDALTPFGWVLCPIMGLANGIYEFFIGFVNDILFFDLDNYSSTGMEKSSQVFVNLANALVVLFGLIIIAGQIFSFEVFSAYTIKKVLPKLIIGVIAIQLSWPLMMAAVSLFNALGSGIYWLLVQPFAPPNNPPGLLTIGDIVAVSNNTPLNEIENAGGFILFGVGVIGVAGALTVAGMWATVILAVIGVVASLVITLLTLIVREIILIVLIVIAPVAIAFWILPGTTKYWDMWYKNLSKLLMMFPLIMGLFAAGAITASILANASPSSQGVSLNEIFAIIAYFAPMFLVGYTFKYAGSAFGVAGNFSNKMNSKAKGAGWFGLRDQAKMRKDNSAFASWRKNRKENLQEKLQTRDAERITGVGKYATGWRGRYSRGVQRASKGIKGDDDTSLNRSQARAASVITSAKEQELKNKAALLQFRLEQIAEADDDIDPTTGNRYTAYQRQVRARSRILDAELGQQTINGQSMNIDQELKNAVAIQALKNKDGSIERGAIGLTAIGNDNRASIERYISDADNYSSLVDYGAERPADYGVLAEKLATAAKGSGAAAFNGPDGINTRGFADAIKGFSGYALPQQTQVVESLVRATQAGGDQAKRATEMLTDLARTSPGVDSSHFAMINTAYENAGIQIDIGELRRSPTATLNYSPSNPLPPGAQGPTHPGRFEIR